MDKVIPEGLALKQVCYSYCKAFSCSYVFLFYLEVLEKAHAWSWDQRSVFITVVNWSGLENRVLLLAAFSRFHKLTLAHETMTFSKGFYKGIL